MEQKAVDNTNEMKIFCGIFSEVDEILKQHDMDMNCQVESFLANLSMEPRRVDVEKLLPLSGDAFVQAAHYACFQKLATREFLSAMQGKSQEEILRAISREGAFTIRGMELVNNPFFEQKQGPREKMLLLASGIKNSIFLRKMAKKMPRSLQDKIRSLFC